MQHRDDKIFTSSTVSVGMENFSTVVQVGFSGVTAALMINSLAAQVDPIRGGMVVDLLQRFIGAPLEVALANGANALIGILG